ncbi:hypothetical protein FACS1894184_10020 [Clostridia bacterium]|nr:hypothetical protein FACS1894184_10020 [Clostridia bacterium]
MLPVEVKHREVLINSIMLRGMDELVYWFENQYQITVLIRTAIFDGNFMMAVDIFGDLKRLSSNRTF